MILIEHHGATKKRMTDGRDFETNIHRSQDIAEVSSVARKQERRHEAGPAVYTLFDLGFSFLGVLM
jgi:hypothetical protein